MVPFRETSKLQSCFQGIMTNSTIVLPLDLVRAHRSHHLAQSRGARRSSSCSEECRCTDLGHCRLQPELPSWLMLSDPRLA